MWRPPADVLGLSRPGSIEAAARRLLVWPGTAVRAGRLVCGKRVGYGRGSAGDGERHAGGGQRRQGRGPRERGTPDSHPEHRIAEPDRSGERTLFEAIELLLREDDRRQSVELHDHPVRDQTHGSVDHVADRAHRLRVGEELVQLRPTRRSEPPRFGVAPKQPPSRQRQQRDRNSRCPPHPLSRQRHPAVPLHGPAAGPTARGQQPDRTLSPPLSPFTIRVDLTGCRTARVVPV